MIRFCRVNPRSFRGLNSLGTGLPSLMKAVPATGSWSGVKYEMLGAALLLLWCSSSKPIEFHNSCIVYIYIRSDQASRILTDLLGNVVVRGHDEGHKFSD